MPFRLYKHFNHEGGISTPLIAHWPKGISRKGEWEKQPGHLIDIMATCVDVSGAAYPKELNGQAIQPMEGRSLTPAFAGQKIDRQAIYWEHEENRAIRVGDYKLVAKGLAGKWELYDIAKDRTEMHDLAETMPDKTKELADLWEAYAVRAAVKPYPSPQPKGAKKGREQTSFKLKSGDELTGEDLPEIAGKTIAITAMITKPAADGVIVAQGGSAHGYSLYMKAGRVVFATRNNNKLTEISTERPCRWR